MIEKPYIQKGVWWVGGLKILVSLLFGGLFYFLWLAAFLLPTRDGRNDDVFLWILAPLVTGFGFAVGIYLFERILQRERCGFFRIYIWPLVGCVLGAVIVYWFGPMLIVFSMLVLGMISVALREIVQR